MFTKTSRVIYLLLLLIISNLVLSDGIYKWIDANGNTIYGSKPPENAQLLTIKGNITSFTSVSVEPFEYDSSLISIRKSTGKTVIMYSTSWCGYCKRAARHFKKNGIPYEDYDIEKSKKAAQEYKKLKGRGVPLILIGNRRMNGFNADRFDRIYNGKS